MATYYEEADIIKHGTKLNGSGQSGMTPRHLHYVAAARGQRVVGIFNRAIFKVTVDVTDFQDFSEFEGQYSSGYILSRDYYAVSADVLATLSSHE